MTKTASEEQLAILDQAYPVEEDNRGPRLPRLGFLSKDLIEESGTGKSKKIKVVQAAGTFYKEVETDEINQETGKKVWDKDFFNDEDPLNGVIFFHRKQLRFYDAADNMFINTPIYDRDDEIVPLFKGSTQIAKGIAKELQALYPALTAKGKPSSKLKEEKILYILLDDGQVYQMNLSQSSKFAFSDYGRKNKVNRLVTIMSASEEKTNGSNTYKHIEFSAGETITKVQADIIVPAVVELNEFIQAKADRIAGASEADKQFDAIGSSVQDDAVKKF